MSEQVWPIWYEDWEKRFQQATAERKAGRLGTLTELGRPFGLSRIEVGRILDAHGLRARVDVPCPPSRDYLAMTEEDKRSILETLGGTTTMEDLDKSLRGATHLNVLRGVVDGYAVDNGNGKEWWVVEKVAPLLAPHAKPKR